MLLFDDFERLDALLPQLVKKLLLHLCAFPLADCNRVQSKHMPLQLAWLYKEALNGVEVLNWKPEIVDQI